MSLLVKDETIDGKKLRAKFAILNMVQSNQCLLVAAVHDMFDQIWNNSESLSPQDVFDIFGTDSAELYTRFSSARTLSGISLPDPQTITINEDHTITVSE